MKKWPFRILFLGFLCFNLIAYIQGYTFTHFSETATEKSDADSLSPLQKLGILFTGISNPRPENNRLPQFPYELVEIPSRGEVLEAWYTEVPESKGDVILFHGYRSKKCDMLERAELIQEMGFNTLLPDFPGSGGSTGNTTTIGYWESQDVGAAVAFLRAKGSDKLFLQGTSMGAAAVLKAVSEDPAGIEGIIIECPFQSLLKATQIRFETMGIPAFPAAQFLVFWGGIQHGFWGFSHSPAAYAKEVELPTLMIYGEKDPRVKPSETEAIFENLVGEKELLLFPEAAHGNYLNVDPQKWENGVEKFLLNF